MGLQLTPVNRTGENLLSLSASPRTDLTGEIGVGDPRLGNTLAFNAPISKVSLPSKSFRRSKATFFAPKSYPLHFDQVGFFILKPTSELPEPSASNIPDQQTGGAFLKVGIETFHGTSFYSVVDHHAGKTGLATSLPSSRVLQENKFTMELIRAGHKLSVFIVETDGTSETKVLFRIVPWVFAEENEDLPPMWVGVFAARPDIYDEATGPLEAHISNFEIEDEYGVHAIS